MSLVATMSFDDEDPTLHVHFTAHARALEVDDPAEWSRVVGVLEDACRSYAGMVARARTVLDRNLDAAREHREAST